VSAVARAALQGAPPPARARGFDLGRPRHGLGVVGSVLLHAGVAFALLNAPEPSDDDLDAVEMSVERTRRPPPPEPEEEEPPPPPEPEPERPRIRAKVAPAPEPPPETPPPELPQAPPTFDLSGIATGEGGSWSMATTEGNTLFAPVRAKAVSRNTAPRREEGVRGGTGTGPATAVPPRISRMPAVEFEARAEYPEQARREGVGGVVMLEVEVLVSGRVGRVRVRTDPGHGLGRAALDAMRRFRFAPALDQDGDAVGYTIRNYRFRFEPPD